MRDEDTGFPKVYMNLDARRLEFADAVDERVQNAAKENSLEWFGTKKPPKHFPLVGRPDDFPERLRVNIDDSIYTGVNTRFNYQPLDGELQKGVSLAALREKTVGKPVSAHAILKLRGIWTRTTGEKSYGAQLYAGTLTVYEEEAPPREDDDFDWEELAPKRRRTE